LYRNQISSIDPATFRGLTSLQTLFLISYPITSIDSATFTSLTSFGKLWLAGNPITSIDPETFLHGLKISREFIFAF